MAPRTFGATKFRNAVPAIPGREEWYRTHLPPSGSAPANTSAYSGVVKTWRGGVLTLTPGGDASVRAYGAVGEREGEVWSGKLGPVADWDVSRLEDAGTVVAGTDGTATYYALTSGALGARHSFSLGGKASSIRLHPTTPGLALAATNVVSIHDVSASSPALTLEAPAPLWTAAWSPDGRLVGGVSKKGQAYVWDARAGSAPTQSRDLSTLLQALKPVHTVFVGAELFVTSFSRSRTRQYSLLNADLSTVFTASVDTSQGPLVPLVDEERRIVYTTGRGDMTLRQVELSGPQGYQEMPHHLPAPLSSGGVAAAHWSTLPVMQAQVATLILPTTDKDGNTLLPLAIKVPRRQLIDYHADLFPDVAGSVPEQSAAEWLAGGDAAPVHASVDPERRGAWEKSVEEGMEKWTAAAGGGGAAVAGVSAVAAAAQSTASPPSPAAAPRAASPVKPASPVRPASPVKASPAPARSPSPTKARSPSPTKAASPAKSTSPSLPGTITNPDLPALQCDETYSSTPYKVRLITDKLVGFQKEHAARSNSPLMVGLQGPQGCGKTTLCDALVSSLEDKNMRVAVLSLDDLYRTHEGLKKLASSHPNNPLLAGRGPPGTHDVELATRVLIQVSQINSYSSSSRVELPIFDKSLCDGEGDRSSDTVSVSGPLDIFILEGWSFGFGPLTPQALTERLEKGDGKYFPQYDATALGELNDYLADFAEKVWPLFEVLVQVEPDSYEHVFRWRLQQEHHMKEKNGGKGMSDEQVHKFVERYMPSYELWAGGVLSPDVPWAGRVVRLRYGKDREVMGVESPQPVARPKTPPVKDAEGTKEFKPAPALGAPAAEIPAPAATRSFPIPASTYATAPSTLKPSSPATSALSKPAYPPPTKAASPPPAAKPSASSHTSSKPSTPTPAGPYNPAWSRKYLAGKTPLNPTYDQIPALQTLHQDSVILRLSPNLAFFPVQGPGGRLLVHPLSKKGRLPAGGVGFVFGGVALADFAADPFVDRVVCAGEDGVLRVWTLSADGVEGAGPEPDVVRGKGVERIVHVEFHPTAQDLLLVASNEHGSSHLRFFDLATGKEEKVVDLPCPVTGFSISPSGQRVALAAKDGRILVLDPRNDGAKIIEGKGHHSPRSAQLAWVGEDHLISLGFGKGSMRQLHLYSVANGVERVSALSLDVSPSVLFPVYDGDTHILYAWGKGQQNILAFQIAPSSSEPIAKLPSFAAGAPQLAVAFFPKTSLDVRKVEVAKCLRLTSRSVEEVTFTVPRNRPQFFQDDIYVPTPDGRPVTSPTKWLAGEPGLPNLVSLRHEGMTPLSEAPAATTTVRHKFVPAANVMSEAQKKQKAMDDLFAKAKGDDSDSDDEPVRGGIPAPDDDDW